MMNPYIFLLIRIGMIIALFVFIGWSIRILWQDLDFHAKRHIKTNAPPISLIRKIGDGIQTIRFTQNEVVLGRDPSCDWQTQDHTLSARHARLSYHHRQWWVEDLNSSNGTYLNEEPVISPMVITNHDQLRCGEILFDIEIAQGV